MIPTAQGHVHLFQTLTCIQKRKCVPRHRGADAGKSMTFLAAENLLGDILKGAREEGPWFQEVGPDAFRDGGSDEGLICGLICCVQ